MEREIKKKYSNGEMTILWQPGKCIHAAACVKALPKVFNPKIRPWIKMENAETEAIKHAVSQCPSGALSYSMDDASNEEAAALETKVEVLENGPLLVYGTLEVTDKDGNKETKNKTTAFCRCGASQNKPYCDGAHIGAKFNG